MRRRTSFVLAIAACLAVFAVVAPRTVTAAVPHVGPSDISFTRISLSPTFGPPTTADRVSGVLFGPTEMVTITFGGATVGTATTDGLGKFVAHISVPGSALPGRHLITATGQTSKRHASASFLVRTDWTEYGFDPVHTGHNPSENVLTTANVTGLTPLWSASLNVNPISAPALWNGRVYIGFYGPDTKLEALDARTSSVLWVLTTVEPVDMASATVAGNVLYVAAGRTIYAVDAAFGKVLWTGATNGIYGSSPVVAGGFLYVGALDSTLDVFAADGCGSSTCQPLWKGQVPGQDAIYSTPTVANGIVYIGSTYGVYSAFAAKGCGQATCSPLWTVTTMSQIYLSAPTVANGIVYMPSEDQNIYAVNASTGAKVWTFTTGFSIYGSVAVANGVVYVAESSSQAETSGTLYALDASSGKELWTGAMGPVSTSSPTVANGVVYVGGYDDKLYMFNAAGCGAASCSPIATYTAAAQISCEPTVANGVIYFGAYTSSGTLYALSLPG